MLDGEKMSESSQRGTNTHLAIAQKLVELGYEASIGRLRIKKSRNNQEAGIHWAKDYEL